MCEGSAFPSTQQSEKNMEILTAWRTVTSDPKFKDSDLADLCSEFSNKARCDGTKVVLEPQGVRNIIESLGQKHRK
jgi:AP-1-like factor